MKRYYISRIVGDGTDDNPFRPKVANANVNWSASMPPVIDGQPSIPWTVVIVGANNHDGLLADSDNDALPDISLDSTLSVLTTTQRTLLLNKLTNRGIDTTGLKTTSTFREVLERLGKRITAAFSSNHFDVSDLP